MENGWQNNKMEFTAFKPLSERSEQKYQNEMLMLMLFKNGIRMNFCEAADYIAALYLYFRDKRIQIMKEFKAPEIKIAEK